MLKKKDDIVFNPLRSFLDFNKEMGRMLDRFTDLDKGDFFQGFRPDVDVIEEDGKFKVKVDLPGMTEKDIEVTVNEGILTIKGERVEEKNEETASSYRRERVFGKFVRQFNIPKTVEAEQVTAKFSNGVLSVTLPITDKATEKKIEIKAE